MNKNRNAYLFVILVILLVLVLVFVFRKSAPKPIQPSPIDTPPTQVEKDVSIIDAASSPDDYYSKIMLYASVLYDNGFCESHSYDVEERKMCRITLNDLSNELTEYNFENLYNFDGKKCDADIISVYINLSESSAEDLDMTVRPDTNCIPREKILQ